MLDSLKKYFGFSEFRPLQREIVEAVLAKNDVFALMPTGAGKSLCFQLPAAMLPGVTIVISPLIALMKDQVDGLNATGIPATFLNSSLGSHEMYLRMKGLEAGEYKLLYIAPERFPSPGFLEFLSGLEVSLCVVDEAHCISEWGHDFREDYRNLHILRTQFPTAPIMAVTATATDRVVADILDQLQIRADACMFRASFDRKNLVYQVWPRRSALQQLLGYLDHHKGESGIVYCLSRDGTESLAESLKANGHKAAAYNARLEKHLRSKVQESFDRSQTDIICATIAFGMGIDKPDVRFVIHYDLPKSIPAYYQETGRAGRDGLPSDCILFYTPGDHIKLIKFFDELPEEERIRSVSELNKLVDLAETTTCRRKELLAYFSETYPEAKCGSCDNCMLGHEVTVFDGTRIAQMFLSCVVRLKQNFGPAYVIDVLRGSRKGRITDFGHHKLSTYGIGAEYSVEEWRHFAFELRKRGLIIQDAAHFSVLKVTAAGWDVLKNNVFVELTRPHEVVRVAERANDLPRINQILFEVIRALLRSIAEEENIPPYAIFNDHTLKEIAARIPVDGASFLAISGVGEVKARQYGTRFLTVIRNFRKDHPEIAPLAEVHHAPREGKITDSMRETLIFYKQGLPLKGIADMRSFSLSTICQHISSLIQNGDITSLDGLVAPEKLAPIRDAFGKLGYATLGTVKEALGAGYEYEDLRFVRAFDEQTKQNAGEPLPAPSFKRREYD